MDYEFRIKKYPRTIQQKYSVGNPRKRKYDFY